MKHDPPCNQTTAAPKNRFFLGFWIGVVAVFIGEVAFPAWAPHVGLADLTCKEWNR